MEIKEITPIQSHIIVDTDGNLYRRNAENDWEQLDADGEEWHPVYYTKEIEKDFQEYLKSKEDGQMSEKYNVGVGIPNQSSQWTGTPITDHTFTGIPQTTSSKTAYIPTVFILPPELKVGDKWYIKYPEDYEVTKVKILELTEKTVQFKVAEDGPAYPSRYKKIDVEFVEKVKE
jgi:hypothetical protein